MHGPTLIIIKFGKCAGGGPGLQTEGVSGRGRTGPIVSATEPPTWGTPSRVNAPLLTSGDNKGMPADVRPCLKLLHKA